MGLFYSMAKVVSYVPVWVVTGDGKFQHWPGYPQRTTMLASDYSPTIIYPSPLTPRNTRLETFSTTTSNAYVSPGVFLHANRVPYTNTHGHYNPAVRRYMEYWNVMGLRKFQVKGLSRSSSAGKIKFYCIWASIFPNWSVSLPVNYSTIFEHAHQQIIIRFVIPVVFNKLTRVECMYLSNTTLMVEVNLVFTT